MPFPDGALFDLVFDPHEADNLADDPAQAEVHADMRQRLDDWMTATDDPLVNGVIPVPPARQPGREAGG